MKMVSQVCVKGKGKRYGESVLVRESGGER